MYDRFYAPSGWANQTAVLEADEARHLRQILRKRVGDCVELFDGLGNSATAIVRELARDEVRLDVTESRTDPPQNFPLVIAVTPPKGERLKWMVEKLVELDVDRLELLLTERSVVDPRSEKLRTLEQTVIAACKQCRRNRLMTISAPLAWPQWLEQQAAHNVPWYLADPQGVELLSVVRECPNRLTIAIGPEGGFSPFEVAAAVENRGLRVRLGQRILRIETAALATAAVFGAMRNR